MQDASDDVLLFFVGPSLGLLCIVAFGGLIEESCHKKDNKPPAQIVNKIEEKPQLKSK